MMNKHEKMKEHEYAVIGRNVVETREHKREYNEAMAPKWKRKGDAMKSCRKCLGISRQKLAYKMQVSTPVVTRLEEGKPVKRRKMAEQAYQLALENINFRRERRFLLLNECITPDENNRSK